MMNYILCMLSMLVNISMLSMSIKSILLRRFLPIPSVIFLWIFLWRSQHSRQYNMPATPCLWYLQILRKIPPKPTWKNDQLYSISFLTDTYRMHTPNIIRKTTSFISLYISYALCIFFTLLSLKITAFKSEISCLNFKFSFATSLKIIILHY